MEKRWVTKAKGDSQLVNDLASVLNIDRTLANLLVQRGITSFDDAKAFFRPQLSDLHDPYLMLGMPEAVERIENAIYDKEKILVYGDYDVDGTTAVALVYSFFRNFTPEIEYYVPDRYAEGYGVSFKGMDYAADNGFKLIISLDCGIKAVDQVAYAKEKGIDFIICDHHRPGDMLPPAVAILDPKQDGCNYPYKELAGCGVGFKLVQAFAAKKNIPLAEITPYLDLVVTAIAADIVPITGENRVLAFYGLKLINTNPREGLKAILHYSGVKLKPEDKVRPGGNIWSRELTISDLVFLAAPRINAAGRIDTGIHAVELLLTRDLKNALDIGELVNANNIERREIDTFTTQQAMEAIAADPKLKGKKSTVVYCPEWHKGVLGIVASRLTDVYYRPTIVLTKGNGLISGSARSVKDFDIYNALDACSELLEHFGGHKYAAGLAIKPENLEAFINRFEEIVSSSIEERMLTPEIEIDAELDLRDITSKFCRILKQFAPFGPENMSPVFISRGVIDTGYGRIVGEKHLKMTLRYPDKHGLYYSAIAFQQAAHFEKIEQGIPFDVCYHLEENEWNGNVSIQLNIKEIVFNDH